MLPKLFEGKSSESSGNAGGTGWCVAVKAERFFECIPMGFSPTNENCPFDDLGEHSEKDAGAESGEGMPHTTGLTGIGQVVKDLRQNGQSAGVACGIHWFLRE